MIRASQNDFPSLYDGTLKCLLSPQCGENIASLVAGLGLRALVLRHGEGGDFRLAVQGAPMSRADRDVLVLPSGIMALIAEDPFDEAELGRLLRELSQPTEAAFAPPMLRASEGRLEAKLFAVMRERHDRAVHRGADLTLAMAVLRKEHQETRATLYRMQDTLWAARAEKPQISALTAVGRGAAQLRAGTSLQQRLPAAAFGLAGFDLMIARAGSGQGYLVVHLMALDDGARLGTWTAGFADLKPGWCHFPFHEILTADYHHVELDIQMVTDNGTPPTLALTSENLVELLQLRGAEGLEKGACLALRVWTGFAGMLTAPRNDTVARISKGDELVYRLSMELMKSVAALRQFEGNLQFLQKWGDGSFLLHPLVNQEVGALIQRAIPTAARRIEAVIGINDNAVNDIQFAICARHSKDRGPVATMETGEWVASSGWVTLRTRRTKERIAMPLPALTGNEALDLYCFTRVPDGGSVDFGQATFFSLEVTLGLQSAKLEPMAVTSGPAASVPEPRFAEVSAAGKQGLIARGDARPAAGAAPAAPVGAPAGGRGAPAIANWVGPRTRAMAAAASSGDPSMVQLSEAALDEVKKLVFIDLGLNLIHRPTGTKLIVHPLVKQMIAASVALSETALPDDGGSEAASLLAIGVAEVACTIGVGPRLVGVVEFRLAIISDAEVQTPCSESMLLALPGSDWMSVDHTVRQTEMVWTLPEVVAGRHLALMTRVPNGGSVDYSSPYFSSIIIRKADLPAKAAVTAQVTAPVAEVAAPAAAAAPASAQSKDEAPSLAPAAKDEAPSAADEAAASEPVSAEVAQPEAVPEAVMPAAEAKEVEKPAGEEEKPAEAADAAPEAAAAEPEPEPVKPEPRLGLTLSTKKANKPKGKGR